MLVAVLPVAFWPAHLAFNPPMYLCYSHSLGYLPASIYIYIFLWAQTSKTSMCNPPKHLFPDFCSNITFFVFSIAFSLGNKNTLCSLLLNRRMSAKNYYERIIVKKWYSLNRRMIAKNHILWTKERLPKIDSNWTEE